MRTILDVVWVAFSAIRSRPLRALLMAVGTFLGVGVIVGSIGVMDSTQGELRLALRQLGGNLVVVSAPEGGSLPPEARDRVASVPTVEGVAGLTSIDGVGAHATDPSSGRENQIAFAVFASDTNLIDVLEVPLAWGRPLGRYDETSATRVVVIGSAVASRIAFDPAALHSVYLGGQPFGIVGVLEPSILAPELDGALLVSHSTAQLLFTGDVDPGYGFMYGRVDERAVDETARILPTVISYGEPGPPPGVSIPSELLSAQAAIDQTLAGAVVGLGLLAMAVGGFGIANVMLITVMERQREIGVRRALGHSRLVIAVQFLTEAVLVGLLGALAGAAIAAGFVAVVARTRDWIIVLNPWLIVGAVVAAIALTVLAALYPAVRAARLQPLDALRAE